MKIQTYDSFDTPADISFHTDGDIDEEQIKAMVDGSMIDKSIDESATLQESIEEEDIDDILESIANSDDDDEPMLEDAEDLEAIEDEEYESEMDYIMDTDGVEDEILEDDDPITDEEINNAYDVEDDEDYDDNDFGGIDESMDMMFGDDFLDESFGFETEMDSVEESDYDDSSDYTDYMDESDDFGMGFDSFIESSDEDIDDVGDDEDIELDPEDLSESTWFEDDFNF